MNTRTLAAAAYAADGNPGHPYLFAHDAWRAATVSRLIRKSLPHLTYLVGRPPRRRHSGGIVKGPSNPIPAILHSGETILTQDQMNEFRSGKRLEYVLPLEE